MASLTFSPTTLHIVLSSLNLLQYEDALIKAGYDYLNCFDTENNTIEELSQELTNNVPMKKPHARKLTRFLVQSAPTAQDVNDGALPIADTIPMPRVLNNTTPSVDPTVPSVDPTVDPQLMGKEMRDQIERDYNSKAAKERAVLVEEHAQKEAAVVKEKAAKKELALLKESLANQAKGESKESSLSPCPEGALRVQPGLHSLSNAVKEAKKKGMTCLVLEVGVHDELGEDVVIDFALKVLGQNRDKIHQKYKKKIKKKKRQWKLEVVW